jgi:DNA replication and repair protein RecF
VIRRIELVDFRNHRRSVIDLSPGVTAVLGRNGQGKTSLVEAVGFLATLRSFRGVSHDALVRDGAATAYVRATIVHSDGREILVECEINRTGPNKVLVNRQRLPRTRDLLGVVRATVFAPTDLQLVYEGPAARRDMLDDALVAVSPRNDALVTEIDRVLRQRNALLKQSHGRLDRDGAATLDVWDEKFAEVGEALGDARAGLVEELVPRVRDAYRRLAGADTPVDMEYSSSWRVAGLASALVGARDEDVRRGVTTTGPHRDDVALRINDMPARSHASQGETRTLALALRLGIHELVADAAGEPPILVLDDVLSELDPSRCAALLANMPPCQVLITAASPLPDSARCDRVLRIEAGAVEEEVVR